MITVYLYTGAPVKNDVILRFAGEVETPEPPAAPAASGGAGFLPPRRRRKVTSAEEELIVILALLSGFRRIGGR